MPSPTTPVETLAALVVLVGTLSAMAHAGGRRRGAAILKMTAATGYVAVALLAGSLHTTYGRILLAGLGLCWLGDLLLIPGGKGATFMGGLAIFLLGHVAYAAAFLRAGVSIAWVTACAAPVVLVGGTVLRWLWRQPLPRPMQAPVVAYMAAISVMVALAWGTKGAGSSWMIPVGAVAFMTSDIFVARERFVGSSPWNTRLGLPLYFAGQALLALSA